jgi:hypothetical protein
MCTRRQKGRASGANISTARCGVDDACTRASGRDSARTHRASEDGGCPRARARLQSDGALRAGDGRLSSLLPLPLPLFRRARRRRLWRLLRAPRRRWLRRQRRWRLRAYRATAAHELAETRSGGRARATEGGRTRFGSAGCAATMHAAAATSATTSKRRAMAAPNTHGNNFARAVRVEKRSRRRGCGSGLRPPKAPRGKRDAFRFSSTTFHSRCA